MTMSTEDQQRAAALAAAPHTGRTLADAEFEAEQIKAAMTAGEDIPNGNE